jgi:hypothetical protein
MAELQGDVLPTVVVSIRRAVVLFARGFCMAEIRKQKQRPGEARARCSFGCAVQRLRRQPPRGPRWYPRPQPPRTFTTIWSSLLIPASDGDGIALALVVTSANSAAITADNNTSLRIETFPISLIALREDDHGEANKAITL